MHKGKLLSPFAMVKMSRVVFERSDVDDPHLRSGQPTDQKFHSQLATSGRVTLPDPMLMRVQSSGRFVANTDISRRNFRIAGDTPGTPKVALAWFSIRARGVPLQA